MTVAVCAGKAAADTPFEFAEIFAPATPDGPRDYHSSVIITVGSVISDMTVESLMPTKSSGGLVQRFILAMVFR